MAMGTLATALLSFAATATVIHHAYSRHPQFYPAVVYIAQSNTCLLVCFAVHPPHAMTSPLSRSLLRRLPCSCGCS